MSDHDVDPKILANQIQNIRDDLVDIKKELQKVLDGQHQVIRLEERYLNHGAAIDRAFTELREQGSRITKLELEAPLTKMVRNWVVMGVVGLVALVGVQLVTVVFLFLPQLNQPAPIVTTGK